MFLAFVNHNGAGKQRWSRRLHFIFGEYLVPVTRREIEYMPNVELSLPHSVYCLECCSSLMKAMSLSRLTTAEIQKGATWYRKVWALLSIHESLRRAACDSRRVPMNKRIKRVHAQRLLAFSCSFFASFTILSWDFSKRVRPTFHHRISGGVIFSYAFRKFDVFPVLKYKKCTKYGTRSTWGHSQTKGLSTRSYQWSARQFCQERFWGPTSWNNSE